MIAIRNLSVIHLILFTGIFVLGKCYANSDVQRKLIENGWEYVSQGEDDKAEALMRELEKSQYKNQAQVLLGAIQYNKGNYIEAIETLSQVKEYYDKTYNGILDKHIDLSRNNNAQEDELNYFRVHSYLGKAKYELHYSSGEIEEELIKCVGYLRSPSTPGDLKSIYYLANVEYGQNEYERAMGHWLLLYRSSANLPSKIISLNESTEFLRMIEYNIACCYAKMGFVNETIIWLKKSLTLNADKRWRLILSDKDLDNVRNDKMFIDFVDKKLKQNP